MSNSQCLVSALKIRSNVRVRLKYYASSSDFQEKMRSNLSLNSISNRGLSQQAQAVPYSSFRGPKQSMGHRCNYSNTSIPSCFSIIMLNSKSRGFAERRPNHFQQEQIRTFLSWTSSSNDNESDSVSRVVSKLVEKFENEDIPEAAVSAEYIVAHALGVKQLSDFARIDQTKILSADERKRITELSSQKSARVPMQYIIGEWDFRDITLKMKPPVFIPRPETEMLVDLLVSHYEEDEKLRILEVGSGSGAICLSLLHEFDKAHVTAIDASKDAVRLTQENASRLGLSNRLCVHHTALTDESPLRINSKYGTRYDVIVSNPPYLFTKDMDDLDPEILRNEDHMALEAGTEGMDVIKAIIKHARFLLKPHGLVWLETDTRHHHMIQEWLGDYPAFSVQFNNSFLDFTDRARFCQLEYSP